MVKLYKKDKINTYIRREQQVFSNIRNGYKIKKKNMQTGTCKAIHKQNNMQDGKRKEVEIKKK